MPQDAIVIQNVSKTFRIPHERKTTLFEHLSGLFDGKKGYEEFEALKNINFTRKISIMQVRLAFATAIQTDPEILLMDEVLAVGDMEFQQKCLDGPSDRQHGHFLIN